MICHKSSLFDFAQLLDVRVVAVILHYLDLKFNSVSSAASRNSYPIQLNAETDLVKIAADLCTISYYFVHKVTSGR